jgi:hypothetical protein
MTGKVALADREPFRVILDYPFMTTRALGRTERAI